MHHFADWAQRLLLTAATEPTIVDQAPNYGGPTTTVFYVAGGIILGGAILLWIVFQLRNRGK